MVETATTAMGVNPWEVSQALCVSHYYNSLISQIFVNICICMCIVFTQDSMGVMAVLV